MQEYNKMKGGCRIGKVRYKHVPHLVEIVPHVRGSEFRGVMHNHVDLICDYHPQGIAGFAIVAWGFNGEFSRGTRIHNDSFVGNTMLPGFVADILRRDTIRDIIDDTFF